MTSTRTTKDGATRPTQQRGVGELIVDLVIVIGAALYLWTAQNYPAAGRQIPTVVGSIMLVVGLIQLIGWFVPPLWTLTHGNKPVETVTSDEVPPASQGADMNAHRDAASGDAEARKQDRDTAVVIVWAAGFLAAILVLGYRYAVPLFFLAYFGSRKQWKLAVGSAVVMWALTQFVFISLLGIHLPTSQFFTF